MKNRHLQHSLSDWTYMAVYRSALTCLFLVLYASNLLGQQTRYIELKNKREIFIDNFLIESSTNISHTLCRPLPAVGGIRADMPWEGKYLTYATIVKVGTGYKMYYRGSDQIKDGLTQAVTCYAESKDGITWVKPKLGLYTVAGTKDNNVVMVKNPQESTENFTVLYDDRKGIPASERYKAIGGHTANILPRDQQGTFRYVSLDGIRWTRFKDTTGLFKNFPMDSHNVLTWLPAEECYAIYLRASSDDKPGDTRLGKGYRTIARSVSKDFVHWTEPEKMNFGDTQMEHLYTNATQPYFRAPHILIGMPMRLNLQQKALTKEDLIHNCRSLAIQANVRCGFDFITWRHKV